MKVKEMERMAIWSDLRNKPGLQTQRGVCVVAALLLTLMAFISVVFAFAGVKNNPAAGITAFLIFLAAAAIGAALGFLFGLPRARLAEELAAAAAASQPSDKAGGGASAAPTTTRWLANSNLIKVSDWATTILIGLGLASLGNIIPAASDLATALTGPLGGSNNAGAIGLSMAVIGATTSLLLTYLWTSLRLRELMNAAEDEFGTQAGDRSETPTSPTTPEEKSTTKNEAALRDSAEQQQLMKDKNELWKREQKYVDHFISMEEQLKRERLQIEAAWLHLEQEKARLHV